MFAKRVGNVVIRPRHRGSHSCNRLLAYLHSEGFTSVPKPIGVEDKWERVSYVEGTIPNLPLPKWAATDQVLVNVAGFLRSYHEAVRSFPRTTADQWQGESPKGFEGNIICHQDVSPSNVVFRDGAPSALIDFEMAGPANALWDVALTARYWVPLKDPRDLDPSLARAKPAERFEHFCKAYGLDEKDREKVLEGAIISLEQGLRWVREQVKREDAFHMALWIRGYEGINRRSRSWLEKNREILVGGL